LRRKEGGLTVRRSTSALSLAALCAVLVHSPAAAQRTTTSAPARETPAGAVAAPSVVSIRINAVVTDRRGRSLVDLKPGDFQLDDNGIAQKLASVELRSHARPTSGGDPILSDADEQAAARDPETRVFALYLDEFNVAPGANSARVRDVANRFVAEYVRPRDLVLVMKPMGPVAALRFTRDRGPVTAAIDAFEGRKGDYEPRSPFEQQYFGRTPATVEGARAQIVTTGLRELTMKLGELRPARAAVVLVSEGFVRAPGGERRRLPDWQSLARAASHFNLPIYTLDPRDPAPADPDGTGTDRGQLTLQSLASYTGGEAARDAREMLPALARISRDLDAYYVLTYEPSEATDGRFHPIVVRTTRKDAEIRVPSGYWSPLSSEWRAYLDRAAAPPGSGAPTRTLRRSGLINTWFGFERDPGGQLRFLMTWEPTMAGAKLRAQPHDIMLKVSTPQGDTLFESEVGAVAPAGSAAANDRARFPVGAGRMQLDFSIRSADGAVIDTATQDIDVPVLRGTGPVLLQPQLIRARTVREFQALAVQAVVAPTPSRTFSRGERLLIRVPAYNPDGTAVTVSVALTNARGQTIRQVEALPVGADTSTSQFVLPLAFLAPGEYSFDVKVASATGTARQLVRFRLIA
jgi:VWFA-related protein